MKLLLIALLLAGSVPAAAADPITLQKRQAADGSHVLMQEVVVDAPIAAVWKAVSTAEGWKTWATPAAWSPSDSPDIIETSYSPGAQPNDASTIKQQVVARLPEVLMVFRTVKAPAGFPDFDTYAKVTSAFELEPAGEGKTKVRLTGAGFADTDAGKRLLGFFQKGNAMSLQWLRTRFADGPIDWSKQAAGGE